MVHVHVSSNLLTSHAHTCTCTSIPNTCTITYINSMFIRQCSATNKRNNTTCIINLRPRKWSGGLLMFCLCMNNIGTSKKLPKVVKLYKDQITRLCTLARTGV